jgi:hypothetical protein
MMAIAAFALAIGNAQARLGWTLADCKAQWGQPFATKYNPVLGLPSYGFHAQPQLDVQVWMFNGAVASINYLSLNGAFLSAHAEDLLQRNASGNWQLYDDGLGKATIKTWQLNDANGQPICYAILKRLPSGWYRLQVSMQAWSEVLQSLHASDAINA